MAEGEKILMNLEQRSSISTEEINDGDRYSNGVGHEDHFVWVKRTILCGSRRPFCVGHNDHFGDKDTNVSHKTRDTLKMFFK